MFGLSPSALQTIQKILSRYPEVESAMVFGSRAKGNYREGSDIDLALSGPHELNQKLLQLKNEFDESSLPYTVDLVFVPEIKHAELLEHIRRVGQPLYHRKG